MLDKQAMDDLMQPVAWLDLSGQGLSSERKNSLSKMQPWNSELYEIPLYTADQMREYAKKAVEAEQAIHQERLKFTAERWEIECKSQVEIEREACAITGGRAAELCGNWPDGQMVADAIRARTLD